MLPVLVLVLVVRVRSGLSVVPPVPVPVEAYRSVIACVFEVVALARGLMLLTHSRLLYCGVIAALLLGLRARTETRRPKWPLVSLVPTVERFHVRVQVQGRICCSLLLVLRGYSW